MIEDFTYRIVITDDYDSLCDHAAAKIAHYVKREPEGALGLFTGSTPIGVFKRLVYMQEQKGLDFRGITCFNLDERYPIDPDAPQSFNYFMRDHFFNHIKVRAWHIPDGRQRSARQIADENALFEERIIAAGGIGLQGLGIGYNTHIGYNEPGSALNSRTRLVDLETSTCLYATSEYAPNQTVHSQGITMGIGTILEAREIFLMASNAEKVGEAMRITLTSSPDIKYPASYVRTHHNAEFCMTMAVAESWMRHATVKPKNVRILHY